MSEAILADKQEMAHQAEVLMREDGVFAQSMAAIEADYIARWRASKSPDEREDLHRKIVLMEDIRNALINVITTGKIDADETEQPKRGLFAWPM